MNEFKKVTNNLITIVQEYCYGPYDDRRLINWITSYTNIETDRDVDRCFEQLKLLSARYKDLKVYLESYEKECDKIKGMIKD